jgi:tetratricopeptide (TPR) repeat protein
VIAGTLAMLGWVAAVVWLWKKRQPEALGLLLFLGALAPAFLLPYEDMNMMAERYLYLPSVGVCWVVARWWPRGRVATALLLIVLAAFSARTVVRNLDWRDEVAFYQKSIAMSPRLAEVRVLLGSVYLRRNNLPAALQTFQDAVELKPRLAEPRNNLGLIYSQMHQSDRAIEEFTKSAQLAQESGQPYAAARTYSNIGIEYRRLGRLPEAIAAYDRALEIEPRLVGARNNRGYALLVSGRVAEAEADFRRTIELEPMFPMAHSNLGLLYLMRGDLPAAEAALRESLRISPRDPETLARLGDVAASKGDRLAAQEMYRRALDLGPDNQRARQGLVRLGAGR